MIFRKKLHRPYRRHLKNDQLSDFFVPYGNVSALLDFKSALISHIDVSILSNRNAVFDKDAVPLQDIRSTNGLSQFVEKCIMHTGAHNKATQFGGFNYLSLQNSTHLCKYWLKAVKNRFKSVQI